MMDGFTNNRTKIKEAIIETFHRNISPERKRKKKDRTINRHSGAVRERASEPEEILKIIWHVQAAHKQNTHCLLLLSSAED